MLAQPPGGRLPRAQAIGRVQFTLLSSDEQKKHAALTLETSEPLEHGSARVHPLGPLSKALGAIERGDICSSCKGGAGECRSHAGTLSLHGTLLIEPKTIPLLVQLLTCVCFGCRELLLTGTRHDDLKMATAMRAAVHLECRQFTTLLESVHDTGRVRFQKLFDLARIRRTCFHCLRLQPDFRETPRGIEFIVRSRGGGSKNKKKGLASSTTSTSWTWLQPKALLALLKGISNETYARLGLAPRVSHPSWTVHDHLPFPPLALCPPRRQDLADRVLDHIATRAVRISDEARKLSLRTGLRESERERRARDLQLAYRGMLLSAPAENARTKAPSHGAQRERVEEWTLPVDLPLQSRLEGKEGDIRLRLLGHRVEQTARGVIVESPEIPPGWVGVPADVARKLCVHVTVPVQEEARRALQRNVVDRGMYDPAGARAVQSIVDGSRIMLRVDGGAQSAALLLPRRGQALEGNARAYFYARWVHPLAERRRQRAAPTDLTAAHVRATTGGDTCERHLRTGDYILFDRAPSAREESISMLRVFILYHTSCFWLNPVMCYTFGADFDGDEMVALAPSTITATFEGRRLMSTRAHDLSGQDNGNHVGCVQTGRLGLFWMPDITMDKYALMRFIADACRADDDDAHFPTGITTAGRRVWSGTEALSLLLPRGIPRYAHGQVQIVGGQWSGRPDRHVVGMGARTLASFVARYLPRDWQPRIVSRLQLAGCHGAQYLGVSVSFEELLLGSTAARDKQLAIERIRRRSTAIMRGAKEEFEALWHQLSMHPLKRALLRYQNQPETVARILSRADRADVARLRAAMLDPRTRARAVGAVTLSKPWGPGVLEAMIASGARSDVVSRRDMMLFGGESISGFRRAHWLGRRRAFPHMVQTETHPIAHGFITDSLCMTRNEFAVFSAAEVAQDGAKLQFKAVPENGYGFHRFCAFNEDVRAEYDGTIRDARGRVIQYAFGNDGIHPRSALPVVMPDGSTRTLPLDAAEIALQLLRKPLRKPDAAPVAEGKVSYLTEGYLTMYERARIEGLECERLALGAFTTADTNGSRGIPTPEALLDMEMEQGRVPLAIRRTLPGGQSEVRPCSSLINDLDASLISAADADRPIPPPSAEDRQEGHIPLEWRREAVGRLGEVLGVSGVYIAEAHKLSWVMDARPPLPSFRPQQAPVDALLEHIQAVSERISWASYSHFEAWVLAILQTYRRARMAPGTACGLQSASAVVSHLTQMALHAFKHGEGKTKVKASEGLPNPQQLLAGTRALQQPTVDLRLEPGVSLDTLASRWKRVRLSDWNAQWSVVRTSTRCILVRDHPWRMFVDGPCRAEGARAAHAYAAVALRLEVPPTTTISVDEWHHCLETIARRWTAKLGGTGTIELRDSSATPLPLSRNRPFVAYLSFAKSSKAAADNEEESDKDVESALYRVGRWVCAQVTSGWKDLDYLAVIEGSAQDVQPRVRCFGTAQTKFAHLSEVMNTEGVDATACTSNNIHEVLQHLDVEAAIQRLYNMLCAKFEAEGKYVDRRHLQFTADALLFTGEYSAFTRHSREFKDHTGPLKQIAFEQALDNATASCFFGRTDPLYESVARNMTANPARKGTGAFDVLVDRSLLASAVPQPGALFLSPPPAAPQHEEEGRWSPLYDPQQEEARRSPLYDPSAVVPMEEDDDYVVRSPTYSPTNSPPPAAASLSPAYDPLAIAPMDVASPTYCPNSPTNAPQLGSLSPVYNPNAPSAAARGGQQSPDYLSSHAAMEEDDDSPHAPGLGLGGGSRSSSFNPYGSFGAMSK